MGSEPDGVSQPLDAESALRSLSCFLTCTRRVLHPTLPGFISIHRLEPQTPGNWAWWAERSPQGSPCQALRSPLMLATLQCRGGAVCGNYQRPPWY